VGVAKQCIVVGVAKQCIVVGVAKQFIYIYIKLKTCPSICHADKSHGTTDIDILTA